MSSWRLAVVVGGGMAAAAACSVVNAPDDVEDPNTGAGGVGATGGSTAGGGGSGGSGGSGGDCGELNTLENCGQCGVACEPENAVGATCASGTCTYTSCVAPYQDCDLDRANGCESDPATDPENCGGCSHDCADEPFQNVAEYSCAAEICGWSTCAALFDNCDDNDANGCEHAINTLDDCGACGVPCQPENADGATCDSGSCDYGSCQGAWGDCDNDRTNGCETDTLTDHDHCGACNDPCNANEQCGSGTCSTAQILQNEIPYGNWIYATLDDAPPAADYGTWIDTCQTSYVTMPMGWELVPEDQNIVTNIIAVNTWSTHCILFESGVSYGTPAYGAGTNCGCSGTACMEQSGNDWHVTSCSRRILIRRPN